MIRRILLALAIVATPLLFVSAPGVSAVDLFNKDLCNRAQQSGSNVNPADSAVCKDKEVGDRNPLFGANGILTVLINLLTMIVAIVAVIVIVLAGLKMITSGNNPQDVSNARERIIYACVALVIAALAQVMVRFIIGKVELF